MIGSVVSSAIKQVRFGSTAETQSVSASPLKSGHAQSRHKLSDEEFAALDHEEMTGESRSA